VTEKTNPTTVPARTHYKLSWGCWLVTLTAPFWSASFLFMAMQPLLATALKHPTMRPLLELDQKESEIAFLFF
jgi:hypothetical protein